MFGMKFFCKIIVLLFKLSVLTVKCEEHLLRTHAGEEVDIRKVPYTVSISYVCTGALVKPQWVLSAAHCFVGSDWRNKVIRLGATDMTKPKYVTGIKKVYIHPEYEKNVQYYTQAVYDIALIKLSNPAVLSEYIQLLELEETPWPPVDKRECTLAGYGLNIYNNTKLHMSKFDFTEGCDCIQDKRIKCTKVLQDGDDSPCFGDSGGVVVCDNKGVAVTSLMASTSYCNWHNANETELRCNIANSLYLFSHMQPHLEWFNDIINNEPDTYLHSKASTLTMKNIHYCVITTSVQQFALLIIFSLYFD